MGRGRLRLRFRSDSFEQRGEENLRRKNARAQHSSENIVALLFGSPQAVVALMRNPAGMPALTPPWSPISR